jgi:hypothetical protein
VLGIFKLHGVSEAGSDSVIKCKEENDLTQTLQKALFSIAGLFLTALAESDPVLFYI